MTTNQTVDDTADDEFDNDDSVYNDDGEDYADLLHPVQVLKETTYELYTGQWYWTTYGLDFRARGDLYASIYGNSGKT